VNEYEQNRLKRIEDRIDHLTADVSEIKTTLAKQKGFIAGFSMAFTLLWGMLIGLVVYIWQTYVR
jgi:hypothetical protein